MKQGTGNAIDNGNRSQKMKQNQPIGEIDVI